MGTGPFTELKRSGPCANHPHHLAPKLKKEQNYTYIPPLGVCGEFNLTEGDSGRKINVLQGGSIGHCEKNVHMNMYLVLNTYRDEPVLISRSNYVRFLFVGLDEAKFSK
jgi:hypothetical protein